MTSLRLCQVPALPAILRLTATSPISDHATDRDAEHARTAPRSVTRATATVGTMENPATEKNGLGDFEVLEEVHAQTVEIIQGGAALVQAETVVISQGGAQRVEATEVSISRGGAMTIGTQHANLDGSAAAVIRADTVRLNSATAGFAAADTVVAQDSTIGILIAGTIEGEPDVKLDARAAAAMGAGAAVAFFVLRRIFSRS